MNNRDKQRASELELRLNQGSEDQRVAVPLGRLDCDLDRGSATWQARGRGCGAAGDPQRQRRDSDRRRQRKKRKANERRRETCRMLGRTGQTWAGGFGIASVDPQESQDMDKDPGHGSPQVWLLRSTATEGMECQYCLALCFFSALDLIRALFILAGCEAIVAEQQRGW
ncbi:hypothetical protein HL42_2730 [Trichophyton rubrum]|nr:hypothetical protein HL42_2730 [Trichophyton rubrum]